MHFIQKLERKLSFRRNKQHQQFNNNNNVKISDDFSKFICFNNNNNNNNNNCDENEFSYKLVNIKLQCNQCKPIVNNDLPQKFINNDDDHRHYSLFKCKENLNDVHHHHIYDSIKRQLKSFNINNYNYNYNGNRNRIRTNPWYNSRSGGLNLIKQSTIDDDHHYEYIDWNDDYDICENDQNLKTFDRQFHSKNSKDNSDIDVDDNRFCFKSRKKILASISNQQIIEDKFNKNLKRKLNLYDFQQQQQSMKKRKINNNNDNQSIKSPTITHRKCKKIDRLKFELKQIVHVALRDAK